MNTAALPSVCHYTFHNADGELNCATVSSTCALVVGGFADSSVRVWDLDRAGNDASTQPDTGARLAEKSQESSRSLYRVYTGSAQVLHRFFTDSAQILQRFCKDSAKILLHILHTFVHIAVTILVNETHRTRFISSLPDS
jgi:WD40 repeat protein